MKMTVCSVKCQPTQLSPKTTVSLVLSVYTKQSDHQFYL